MSNPNTISGLPALETPLPEDVFPVTHAGNTYKLSLSQIRDALAIATDTAKGLLSATDKAALDLLQSRMANLLAKPLVATVASAETIVIPNDADVIILTGSTNVTAIADATPFKTYVFFYPTGPGISLMGASLPPQGVLVMLHTP
jgi:hypothetical protein